MQFLLTDPFAREELQAQVEKTRVVARCGCGCASVYLEVDPSAPAAQYNEADAPSDSLSVTAHGEDADGVQVQVTLHFPEGHFVELEIWTGEYGQKVQPRPDTLRLKPRLSRKTEYGLALAIAERLAPHLPRGVELVATRFGALELRVDGRAFEPRVHPRGDLESTATGFLNGIAWRLEDFLGRDWLPCPVADDDECTCSAGHAERVGSDVRLWYGDAEHPTLELSPLPDAELEELANRWQAQFAET